MLWAFTVNTRTQACRICYKTENQATNNVPRDDTEDILTVAGRVCLGRFLKASINVMTYCVKHAYIVLRGH